MSGLGVGSLLLQFGGMASSAIGSYYSSATQKINLETQAYLAETNAKIAEIGAQSALYQGQQQVGALTMKAGQLKSKQRASMAANGIDLGVGNAAEIQASTDIMSQTDANTLEANAVRNAWERRTQAVNYQNEALTSRATASGVSPGGSMFSSLLGSAGSVASSWYSLNKAGALKGSIFELGQ